MMLGGLLAVVLLLTLATAIVSASLDDWIYDKQDIERMEIPLAVVAIIPKPAGQKLRQLPARTD